MYVCVCKREVRESERERDRRAQVTKLTPRCWQLSGVQVSPLVPADTVGTTIDRAMGIWL